MAAMSENWINEDWRNERLPPKTKRLYADALAALHVLESDAEKFDLFCILYLLHGSKEKQWAYATNRPDVIGLMIQMLQLFLTRYKSDSDIELNFSYPRTAVQDQLRATGDLPEVEFTGAEQEWVINRWRRLLVVQIPHRQSFNPRSYPRQKPLSDIDPPGTIEIRLRKSLGILLAFRHRGEQLLRTLAE